MMDNLGNLWMIRKDSNKNRTLYYMDATDSNNNNIADNSPSLIDSWSNADNNAASYFEYNGTGYLLSGNGFLKGSSPLLIRIDGTNYTSSSNYTDITSSLTVNTNSLAGNLAKAKDFTWLRDGSNFPTFSGHEADFVAYDNVNDQVMLGYLIVSGSSFTIEITDHSLSSPSSPYSWSNSDVGAAFGFGGEHAYFVHNSTGDVRKAEYNGSSWSWSSSLGTVQSGANKNDGAACHEGAPNVDFAPTVTATQGSCDGSNREIDVTLNNSSSNVTTNFVVTYTVNGGSSQSLTSGTSVSSSSSNTSLDVPGQSNGATVVISWYAENTTYDLREPTSNTTALSLNGGSIRDISGNNATLTLIPPGSNGSLSANKTLVVDGGAPVVSSVTSTYSDGTYIVGDSIKINVLFSEVVTVTGVPIITLETGDNDAVINYANGTGTNTINFSYVVSEGEYTNDLSYMDQNALELNQGSIKDAAGNNIVLTLPEPDSTGSLSINKSLVVDGILPFVNSVTSLDSNGTYIFGDTIDIAMNFSENVNVSGSPQLILETGSNDASVPYISGSGSSTLIFRYIVQNGHYSLDLGYETDSSLVLNGGSIRDLAGNGSLLNLPEKGSTFSISGSKDIYIDGDIPVVPTNLIATPGLGKVDLTWTENSETDLAYYKVYADTIINPTVYIGNGFVGLQKFSHSGITDGIIWYYRISAIDLAGNELSLIHI